MRLLEVVVGVLCEAAGGSVVGVLCEAAGGSVVGVL